MRLKTMWVLPALALAGCASTTPPSAMPIVVNTCPTPPAALLAIPPKPPAAQADSPPVVSSGTAPTMEPGVSP
ncbi:hypothetical protein I5Q14_23845 [Serratia marcescens]|nr:hypothetical protein [Serratia marcescens]